MRKVGEIYVVYYRYMFKIAYSILKNEQDAEDSVHNAFLKIIERINDLEELDLLQTKNFVRVITKNCAIDIYRKNKRNINWIQESLVFESEHLLENRLNEIINCINMLAPRYREIILLKYIGGFSNSECAEILNISKENANKLLQRAKRKLKENCNIEGIML